MTARLSRICIVTPGHLATNPRVVKEADALSSAGYEVTVVSARYLPWADEQDRAFAGRPWTSLREVAFGPHAPKLRYLWQTLRRRLARAACRLGLMTAAMAEAAQHPASADIARAARSVDADLYIAHYVAALPAAARAARLRQALYGFDAEDFHPGDLADKPEHDFERALTGTIERRYLPGAAHLTAASPGIAAAYAETYSLRTPEVILNVFPLPETSPVQGETESIRRPALYWFSQTVGPGRGLECAIRAIALSACRPTLYLRGACDPQYQRQLQRLASDAGVADRLAFLSTCPPGEMETRGQVFDAGYAGELPDTPNRAIALTNKLFSYLASGLAVVMTDIPAHRELAQSLAGAACLFAAGDPHALARELDHLLVNSADTRTAQLAARSLAHERFNWEVESRRLVAAVARSIEGGSRR